MAEPTTDSQAPAKSEPIIIEAPITVRELAEKLGVKVTELIGTLINMGVMAAINDRLDFNTAQKAAEQFDKVLSLTREAVGPAAKARTAKGGVTRPPVVAVMGHVDHGKTSLLDKIRKTTVAAKEAGGITQHIRAHQIPYKGKSITFLDTPGHEAFSLLREHGAHLTDIALIVVAADDGIKPQTKEAIKFAQAAGVKIIVALTKIDKPNLDLNRVKQQLADSGLNPEEWGGDTIVVETSAADGTGLDKLLDMILLVAEVEELSALEAGVASGTVIETHLAKGKGVMATLLVESGQLKTGDYIVAGSVYGKIRSLEDTEGKATKLAGPSVPVVAAGWKDAPSLGTRFIVAPTEAEAKKMALAPDTVQATVATKSSLRSTGSEAAVKRADNKQLLLLVKADVHGSLEALLKSLEQVSLSEVQVKIVSQGLGDINESDVNLAQSVKAQIVGFNVGLPVKIKQLAQARSVELKIYTVIYELIDDIRLQLEALVEPKVVETKVAELEVKGVFKVTASSLICGGLVTDGKLTRELTVKKSGESEPIGQVVNVQREQQDAKEVLEGQMCGLNIKTKQKTSVAVDDKLEFYRLITQAK